MAEIEVVRDVLIVDDEPDIRLLVRAVIEADASLQVAAEAANAIEALAVMSERDIDVVILDDQLGDGITGTEIAGELKRLRPNAIIVLNSAVTHPLMRPPGVDACLWKFESELLLPTVLLLLDELATSS